jgi:hypothetical protein
LLSNHENRLNKFVKSMEEEPIMVNNEKLSDQRFDPDWKFRNSLRVKNHGISRNSLDYSARTK